VGRGHQRALHVREFGRRLHRPAGGAGAPLAVDQGVVGVDGTLSTSYGRWKSFAFVENGTAPTAAVTQGLDGLAATVEGCW
jgi:D-alanyl-D-alanine carboxypeptidase/D-alanyl-D-alanine-endopeptidase (penicillin-binding protein 4)